MALAILILILSLLVRNMQVRFEAERQALVKTSYRILRTRKSKVVFVMRRAYAPIGFTIAVPIAIIGCLLLVPTAFRQSDPDSRYSKVPETILRVAWNVSGVAGAVEEDYDTVNVMMNEHEYSEYMYNMQIEERKTASRRRMAREPSEDLLRNLLLDPTSLNLFDSAGSDAFYDAE